MKRISRWANQHPIPSRLIIAMGHILLLFLAIYLGISSYLIGWQVPGWGIFMVGNLFFASFIWYPVKRDEGGQGPWRYYRHKITDFILVLTAVLTISGGVNQFANSPVISVFQDPPQARQIVERSVKPYQGPENVGLFKRIKQKVSNVIQSVKYQLKVRKSMVSQTSEGSKNNTLARILYIFLALLLAFGLAYLVAALSCNIACSGAEGLALVVLILGWGGIIWLLIIAIKYIIKNTAGTGTKLKQQI